MKILERRLVRFIPKSRLGKNILSLFILAVGALIIAYAAFFKVEAPSVDVAEYNKGVERLGAAYRENSEEDLIEAARHFEKSAEGSKDPKVKSASLYNMAVSNIEYRIKNDKSVFSEIDLLIAELKEASRYNNKDGDTKYNLSLLLELKSIEPGNIHRELEKEGKPVPLPPAGDLSDRDNTVDDEEIKEKKDPGLKPGDVDMFPPF